jgi:hypothetical protein
MQMWASGTQKPQQRVQISCDCKGHEIQQWQAAQAGRVIGTRAERPHKNAMRPNPMPFFGLRF